MVGDIKKIDGKKYIVTEIIDGRENLKIVENGEFLETETDGNVKASDRIGELEKENADLKKQIAMTEGAAFDKPAFAAEIFGLFDAHKISIEELTKVCDLLGYKAPETPSKAILVGMLRRQED